MPALCSFDYAIVRVVPRVERGEFLNVGVIVSCPSQDFLEARIELDKSRLLAFAPQVDVECVETYLSVIPRVCRGGAEGGPIGLMPARARFHWLVAPRSTIVQISPAHSGLCTSPNDMLDELMDKMVRPVLLPPEGRQKNDERG